MHIAAEAPTFKTMHSAILRSAVASTLVFAEYCPVTTSYDSLADQQEMVIAGNLAYDAASTDDTLNRL
jgi:hypothetical protein